MPESSEGLSRQALGLQAEGEVGDRPGARRRRLDTSGLRWLRLPWGSRLLRARLWQRRHGWSGPSAGRD